MRFIKFAYYLFTKNMFMSIIIVFQLTFSLIVISDVISTANGYFVTINEYENSNLSDINGLIVNIDEIEIPDKIIKSLPQNALKYREHGYMAIYDEYEFMTYSKDFILDYKPEIKSGIWLDESYVESDAIPVVLPYETEGLEVGKTVDLNLDGIKKIKIVGILKNPYYCGFSTGGTKLNTKLMLENISDKIVFLTISDYVPEEKLQLGEIEALVFKDSKYVKDSFKIINKQYYCMTFTDVLENGRIDALSRVKALSPFIILLLMVSLVGMIGCISITTLKNLNFYSILYINGASNFECTLISLFYTSIFIIITLFFNCIVYIFWIHKTMCIYNYLAIFIFVIALLLLSYIPYRILKNNPPVDIFRRTK